VVSQCNAERAAGEEVTCDEVRGEQYVEISRRMKSEVGGRRKMIDSCCFILLVVGG